MADFVSDTRIYWHTDKAQGLVPEGDKEAGDFFCGVGGVVHEDHARRIGLLGEGGGLTVKGRAMGYLAGDEPPERSAVDARAARAQREIRPESVSGTGTT